jgi:hypothetical protein
MTDKTKKDFLIEYRLPVGDGRHTVELAGMLRAMQAYADQQLRKVNEFIRDIGKLLGEEGLGFDGISWTVDDFKIAIDQEKRKEAIAFAEWAADRGWILYPDCDENEEQGWYKLSNDFDIPDDRMFGGQLYDLYLQSIT